MAGGESRRSDLLAACRLQRLADHRAARAGHPDSIVLEPGIQLAAVFMLADEGLEGGAKYIGALPVRFTVMHSCAPHVRKSVSLGGLTLRTRTWAFLPAAVVKGRPMTSHSPHSPASSLKRSPRWSCMGRTPGRGPATRSRQATTSATLIQSKIGSCGRIGERGEFSPSGRTNPEAQFSELTSDVATVRQPARSGAEIVPFSSRTQYDLGFLDDNDATRRIVAIPQVRGLHHRYQHVA
jgi:hypothetical protein